MHSLTFRALLALLMFTCLSFAVARTSVDGKVKFPADEPTFTIEFPSGWTYEADKDGNLDCNPAGDPEYTLSILLLKDIKTEKELKAVVPKLADSMASGAKIKNFEVGDVESSTNGNGIRFTGIRGDGKTEGTDFVVLVHAFETKKGKFYAIVTAGSKKADTKHEKAYDEITASIEKLE
jgi:hypothetical protein